MCAGLIPDVNIKSRPRVFFIFAIMMIDGTLTALQLAALAHRNVNAAETYGKLHDAMIPPLSSEVRLAAQAENMFRAFDKMAKAARKESNE